MRNTIIIIVVIIIAAVSYFSFVKKGKAQDQAAPKISKHQVEKGTIIKSVQSSGRVVSNLDVEIKCKASGEVISLPFDVSAEVKKGELVVELNPVDEDRNVANSQVALESSKARLTKAQLNLTIGQSDLENNRRTAANNLEVAQANADEANAKAERTRQLFEKKLVGQEELDSYETAAVQADASLENAKVAIEQLKTAEKALELKKQDVNLAKADVETAQINLSTAQQRLTDTKVYAPIDGIVTDRKVQTGQIISSGISNTGGGTTILTLSDLSRIYVLASVDESDIGEVVPGQKAIITADAYQGKKFEGLVDRVAQKGMNTSNVVTFEVRIEVTGDNKSLLKPEMTADVEVVIEKKDDVLSVPVGAVTRSEGKQVVTVELADGTSEIREVETGINNGEMIEILSGLQDGDTILINEGETSSRWDRANASGPPRGGPPMGMMGGGGGGRH